jgi:hypothetical protein
MSLGTGKLQYCTGFDLPNTAKIGYNLRFALNRKFKSTRREKPSGNETNR